MKIIIIIISGSSSIIYSAKIINTHFIIPNIFFNYRVNTNLANVKCTNYRWFMC